MNSKYVARTGLAVVLVGLLLCGGSLGALRMINEYTRWEHRRIADRLRVGLDTEALVGIRDHIVQSLSIGMARTDVEQVLTAIASPQIRQNAIVDSRSLYGPITCDEISIRLSHWPLDVWGMSACYDVNGGLVMLVSGDDDYPRLSVFK
jgi:hypothetical protein